MRRQPNLRVRGARPSDVRKVHALIVANTQEGHLLPRTLSDVTEHAERFVVAYRGRQFVGCAELAPLGPLVAEIRSLAVDTRFRGARVGTALVEELRRRARSDGFEKLCAFTHRPGYFSRMGFSAVPHRRIPEKVATDCIVCPLYGQCGQYAVVTKLDESQERPAADRSGLVLRLA